VQDELLKKVGAGDGQVLKPLADATEAASRMVRERISELKQLFVDELDPAKDSSSLGKALRTLTDLLDPGRKDSVQGCVEKAVEQVTGADGALAKTVKSVVAEAIKPLKEEVDSLAKEIRGQQAAAEVVGQTTAKGRPFEEELLPVVQLWASMVGAEVDHVGPDNQPGDILVVIDSSRMAAFDLRIVIEARDDQSGRGKKRILDDMAAALATRKADYGLYVARSTTGLAKEIGDWAELQCAHGPVIACTAEHLRTALRFAVVDHRLRQLKAATPEADVAAIEAEVSRIRSALGRIRTINTKATSIRTGADAITNEATELKREISESLSVIEEALRTVQGTEAGEPAAGGAIDG